MRAQFVKTVTDLLRTNPKTVLLLGDVGSFAFHDAFKEFPDRVFNIGILEQAMVGVAAGWALRGYLPIVHTISAFLVERAYEQLKIDFGYQELKGIFIGVGGSYDYASFGCTHHCPADVSLIRNIPGFRVCVPGTALEVDEAIRNAASGDVEFPTYIRLSEKVNSVEHSQGVTFHSICDGPAVIAVGPVFDMVLDATARLPICLYYANVLPTVFNSDMYPSSHFIVVEPYYASRLGADISNFYWPYPVAVKNFSLPVRFPRNYGHTQDLYDQYGFNATNLRNIVTNLLTHEQH